MLSLASFIDPYDVVYYDIEIYVNFDVSTPILTSTVVQPDKQFVIGGYAIRGETFDALVMGHFQDGKLMHASLTRNGLRR